MEVKFNLPESYAFETKINGQPVVYHPTKMDESWIIRFLEKGMQRYANDMYSGEKGNVKFDLCAAIAAEANSGKPAPQGTARKASLPDDMALAVKDAKADLTIMFKRLTETVKIADMVTKDARVAAYFEEKGDSFVWNDDKVQEWIGKEKEAGRKDYLADAQVTLAVELSAIEI